MFDEFVARQSKLSFLKFNSFLNGIFCTEDNPTDIDDAEGVRDTGDAGGTVQTVIVPTDEYCNPNPCQNEGQCQDGVGGFECICVDGYIGTICDVSGSL